MAKKRIRRAKKSRMNREIMYSLIPTIHDSTKLVSGGFPSSQDVTLKYCETVAVNPGAAGSMGTYAMRTNSLFDPNLTGSGHQPMGRDAWAGIYSRYVVKSSRCIVTFTVASAATDAPTAFGLLVHETGSLSAVVSSTLMEQGRSVYRVASCSSASSSNYPVRLYLEFDAKKWFGIKDITDNSDTFGAVVGSNPSQAPCFVAWIQDLATGADLPVMYVTFEIEYDTHFTCPMEQAAS